MPILEYICEDCQHHFETIVMGAKIPTCPKCQSRKLDKQLSVFAVGGQGDKFADLAPMGACGSCGDPRGPGACALN